VLHRDEEEVMQLGKSVSYWTVGTDYIRTSAILPWTKTGIDLFCGTKSKVDDVLYFILKEELCFHEPHFAFTSVSNKELYDKE